MEVTERARGEGRGKVLQPEGTISAEAFEAGAKGARMAGEGPERLDLRAQII